MECARISYENSCFCNTKNLRTQITEEVLKSPFASRMTFKFTVSPKEAEMLKSKNLFRNILVRAYRKRFGIQPSRDMLLTQRTGDATFEALLREPEKNGQLF